MGAWCLCAYRGMCCPQGTSPGLSIGDEGPNSSVPLPNLQTGVAANLSSVAMCGRPALGHLNLGLPQQLFPLAREIPHCVPQC